MSKIDADDITRCPDCLAFAHSRELIGGHNCKEKTMSDQLADIYDDITDFETLLADADGKTKTDWERDFVSSLNANFERYQERMFLSTAQKETIEKIADR